VIRWAELSVKRKIMVSLRADYSARVAGISSRPDLDKIIVRDLPEAFG